MRKPLTVLTLLAVIVLYEEGAYKSHSTKLEREKKSEQEVDAAVPHVEQKAVQEPDNEPTTRRTRLGDLDPLRHHWYLGVCASTAFSSEWLQEWIELQLLGGVGHIWLIDDNVQGADNRTAGVIAHYEELGFVTGYKGRLPEALHGCGDTKGRVKNCVAPKLCHSLVHQYVDQFIFADTDEFIYPTMGCDVGRHVQRECDQNIAHHVIRWERFGTSGHYNMPQGLVVENFLSSGGDCTAQNKKIMDCSGEAKLWGLCMECRHLKTMYNTKCVGHEHVGHPHIAVNTTYWKLKPTFWSRGAVVQQGNTSQWRRPPCTEKWWPDNSQACRDYSLRGSGARFPPQPSADCCTAGIGYNHYGTKSKSHWDAKLAQKTSRGWKPDFALVEHNTTVASNVLRFARAMRQRWQLLGLRVAPHVSFYDTARHATFVEDGWRYLPAADRGTREELVNVTSAEGCADACWARDAQPPALTRCGGWSFHKQPQVCYIVHSPLNSWQGGRDLGFLRWPHTAFSADRVIDPAYVSGIPLHEGECPLPERLRGEH